MRLDAFRSATLSIAEAGVVGREGGMSGEAGCEPKDAEGVKAKE
jgi:hypothetical protein